MQHVKLFAFIDESINNLLGFSTRSYALSITFRGMLCKV